MDIEDICYTSVAEGLSSATYATPRTIQKAILLEQKNRKPRIALIQGLQRELRRRKKQCPATTR